MGRCSLHVYGKHAALVRHLKLFWRRSYTLSEITVARNLHFTQFLAENGHKWCTSSIVGALQSARHFRGIKLPTRGMLKFLQLVVCICCMSALRMVVFGAENDAPTRAYSATSRQCLCVMSMLLERLQTHLSCSHRSRAHFHEFWSLALQLPGSGTG